MLSQSNGYKVSGGNDDKEGCSKPWPESFQVLCENKGSCSHTTQHAPLFTINQVIGSTTDVTAILVCSCKGELPEQEKGLQIWPCTIKEGNTILPTFWRVRDKLQA